MDDNKNQNPIAPSSEQQPTHISPQLIINGESAPLASINNRQTTQVPDKKPSKWRYFFGLLGILQLVGIALFILVMFGASQQAKAGASGTEFIALFLFVTFIPALALIAVINLIGLPIYLIKAKPRGKSLAFAVISLTISSLLCIYSAYTVYSIYSIPNKLAEQSRIRSEERDREFAAANSQPEISKEKAIELLNTCKLKGFYYTKQDEPENYGNIVIPSPGASSTGIVLVAVKGEPYRISIADRLISELVPIAREAQKKCGGPQFWHDGTYEQYKDGKWYFKGEVIFDTRSGSSKEDAILFMKNCKADYFVGYTDINLVKEENTKSWLNKAEQSTSGIEISEQTANSYIFVSKALTTELQDVARQYRDKCYNEKKLYITIDDWIETEYPIGQWTKVKQRQ